MATHTIPDTKHIWGFYATAWIHQDHVGYIIGNRGTTVRGLSSDTGCIIQTVCEYRSQIGFSNDSVQMSIVGFDSVSVTQAYYKLMELAREANSTVVREEPYNEFNISQVLASQMMVPVDNQVVGFIIGKNGNTINKIGCDTSCSIKIQKSNPQSGMKPWFLLRGTNPLKLKDAAHRIYTIEAEGIARANRPKSGEQNLLSIANIQVKRTESSANKLSELLTLGC